MLKLVIKDDRAAAPVITCDHCDDEIADAKQGNYEWEIDDRGQPVDGRLWFTHKACCRPFEEAHGGRIRWACMELAVLPVYLANNLGIHDWAAARKLAGQLGSM